MNKLNKITEYLREILLPFWHYNFAKTSLNELKNIIQNEPIHSLKYHDASKEIKRRYYMNIQEKTFSFEVDSISQVMTKVGNFFREIFPLPIAYKFNETSLHDLKQIIISEPTNSTKYRYASNEIIRRHQLISGQNKSSIDEVKTDDDYVKTEKINYFSDYTDTGQIDIISSSATDTDQIDIISSSATDTGQIDIMLSLEDIMVLLAKGSFNKNITSLSKSALGHILKRIALKMIFNTRIWAMLPSLRERADLINALQDNLDEIIRSLNIILDSSKDHATEDLITHVLLSLKISDNVENFLSNISPERLISSALLVVDLSKSDIVAEKFSPIGLGDDSIHILHRFDPITKTQRNTTFSELSDQELEILSKMIEKIKGTQNKS